MNLSPAGLDRIKSYESLRLKSYQDDGGVWTIGWGHTGADVGPNMLCSAADAEAWLWQDTASAVAAVNRLVTVPLSQGEFDAVVDFCFNEGQGHLAGSSLLRYLNAGKYELAAQEFEKWDIVKGQVSAGLLRRRQDEEDGFMKGIA